MSAPVITIYKNGDHHFLGKKLVVNRKHYRSFENFLDKVTEDTRAGVAIRKIHTPHHGTKIASLEKIQNGAIYVAAGTERFRHIEYDKIGENLTSKPNTLSIKPVFHSKIIAPSRYKKEAMAEPLRNRIIYVYRNGEEKSPPMKLLLDKRTLKNMNTLLQYISNKINLTAGAVKSLYSLDTGVKVTDVNEINTNMLYVAVGTGKHFVKGKYFNNDISVSDKLISPKHKTGGYSSKFTKSKEMKRGEENVLKPVVTGLSPEDGLNNINVKSPVNDDQSEVDKEDMLSYSSKEKSDTNFIDKILDSASDTVEQNSNEINETISEIVNKQASATPISPVNIGNAEPIDELPGTPPAESPIVKGNDELINSESVHNELSGTPPSTSAIIDGSDEHTTEIIDHDILGTQYATTPIVDEHITEIIDNELSGTPAVNDPINMSDEPISESIDNELSGTPEVNKPDETINESIDNELSGGTPTAPVTPILNESGDVTSTEQTYKASGKQQESGDQVKDDKETVVEELIDKVPAVEVDEELENRE